MNINIGGCNGTVPHESFESKQICAIFVMVGGKGMPEGMAGKTVFPAEFFFVKKNKIRDALMINRLIRMPFLRKEPVIWSLTGMERIPVLQDKFPNFI